MRFVVRLFVAAVILALAGAGGAYYWLDRAAKTPVDANAATVEFLVPKGATLKELGRMLEEQKVINSALAWRLWARLFGAPAPKAGRHAISAGLPFPEIMKK